MQALFKRFMDWFDVSGEIQAVVLLLLFLLPARSSPKYLGNWLYGRQLLVLRGTIAAAATAVNVVIVAQCLMGNR